MDAPPDRIPALPADAAPAVEIVRRLRDAGHAALLAGGCVRDLLRGAEPEDYDVATDARPEEVCRLFRHTRQVGAQFGVVLVRRRGRWIEVATFRTDDDYADGRRPRAVHFAGPREDALRRDFTINGMFLDPLDGRVIDYVGGREDLRRRQVRAIGDPAARFAEDHLRLLRAVRFAARLDFQIEPATAAALRAAAPLLERVAPERVRDELERMFAHPGRARALALLRETGLLAHLWPGARWDELHVRRCEALLARLPGQAGFPLVWAVLMRDRPAAQIEQICRRLAFSNEQRRTVLWLVEHAGDLQDPQRPSLAELKRLMAHPAFPLLADIARAAYAGLPDGAARAAALEARCAAVPPEAVAPPPLVTGQDLLDRGVPPGPVYQQVLDELYTRQLNEELTTRAAALAALEQWLTTHGVPHTPRPPDPGGA